MSAFMRMLWSGRRPLVHEADARLNARPHCTRLTIQLWDVEPGSGIPSPPRGPSGPLLPNGGHPAPAERPHKAAPAACPRPGA